MIIVIDNVKYKIALTSANTGMNARHTELSAFEWKTILI